MRQEHMLTMAIMIAREVQNMRHPDSAPLARFRSTHHPRSLSPTLGGLRVPMNDGTHPRLLRAEACILYTCRAEEVKRRTTPPKTTPAAI